MTGRRIRRLVILVLMIGVGYWIYKDQPTVSGLVDSITNPIMGSRAAVKSSERNRVVGDATTAITEQSDAAVGTLKEGMTTSEVRELLGNPDSMVREKIEGVERFRWTYAKLRRVLLIQDGRVVSIVVR
jgi:hypothetical protein